MKAEHEEDEFFVAGVGMTKFNIRVPTRCISGSKYALICQHDRCFTSDLGVLNATSELLRKFQYEAHLRYMGYPTKASIHYMTNQQHRFAHVWSTIQQELSLAVDEMNVSKQRHHEQGQIFKRIKLCVDNDKDIDVMSTAAGIETAMAKIPYAMFAGSKNVPL
jgi:phage terminase large subunit GpA-like protein